MNTAYGYAGMGDNTTTIAQETVIEKPQDLKNATDSDQDIIMAQHLIELDAVQFQSENKLLIRETLIFKNMGSKDFYGSLMTWLPDGIENIKLSKSEMMTSGEIIPLEFNKTGNIISWQGYVEQNKIASFLYYVDYIASMGPGASSITGIYSKKLAYPTLIKYDYNKLNNPDLLALVIRITKPNESSVKFLDENRNEITPVVSDENEGIYRFSSIQFKEINVELSKSSPSPAAKQDYSGYTGPIIVIGLLILLVLLYPYISKKLKRGEEKSGSGNNSVRSKGELKGKSDIDLDSPRKELGLKLKELEEKYKSGDLLDEEYEDEKNAIQNKLKSINKRSK
ncbi:MAG: hypothetical protein WC556_12975 [Candidatus Methanoperedens sp.]